MSDLVKGFAIEVIVIFFNSFSTLMVHLISDVTVSQTHPILSPDLFRRWPPELALPSGLCRGSEQSFRPGHPGALEQPSSTWKTRRQRLLADDRNLPRHHRRPLRGRDPPAGLRRHDRVLHFEASSQVSALAQDRLHGSN